MDVGQRSELDANPDPNSVAPEQAAAPPAPDPAPVPDSRTASRPSWLRRFLLMRDQLEAAEQQAFGADPARQTAFRRAVAARDAAEVVAGESRVAACVLLKDSLLWATRAASLQTPASAGEAWASLESNPEATGLSQLPEACCKTAHRAFVDTAPLDTWEKSRDEAEADLAALRRVVDVVLKRSSRELRAVAHLRMIRRLRWALVALIPVVIAAGIVTLRIVAAQRANLAFHKPTASSSTHGKHKTTNGVVDGELYGIGFHTAHELRPWLRIDLQGVKRIRQITVYNSDHCCYERAVPLVIEVSTDGKEYTQVARRERPFGVWEADIDPIDARYVKLYADKNTFLHLSEVEVR
jgi:hypothetical protein